MGTKRDRESNEMMQLDEAKLEALAEKAAGQGAEKAITKLEAKLDDIAAKAAERVARNVETKLKLLLSKPSR